MTLADLVALAHALFSVFVVGGLVLHAAGLILRWRWVRHPAFRAAHLGAVLLVAIRAWLGVPCPLTRLEDSLRQGTGGAQPALIQQAHRLAFRGEAPDRFRRGVTTVALASIALYAIQLAGRSGRPLTGTFQSSSRR